MNVEELQFTLNGIIGLITGIAGAVGFWFSLKGKINLIQQKIDTLEDAEKALHKRIDKLKDEVSRNRERSDMSSQEIKTEMNQMELRIIQAIHEIKR